ncbi:MAG TPA: hypothetical protein VFP98_08285, partial [Candidatus Polarisedimenticolia bacterium]|nr:hypothetical protein [Candidatus Polarisedimenticolia bacterium]
MIPSRTCSTLRLCLLLAVAAGACCARTLPEEAPASRPRAAAVAPEEPQAPLDEALPMRRLLWERWSATSSGDVQHVRACVGGDVRSALRVTAPCTLSFDTVVPPAGRLHLGVAYEPGAGPPPKAGVRVELRVAGRKPAREVGRLELRPETAGWVDRSVDLGAFSEAKVRLTVELRMPRSRSGNAAGSSPPVSILLSDLVLMPHAPAAARPNVVLVTIDSLRPDRLGAYGGAAQTAP